MSSFTKEKAPVPELRDAAAMLKACANDVARETEPSQATPVMLLNLTVTFMVSGVDDVWVTSCVAVDTTGIDLVQK